MTDLFNIDLSIWQFLLFVLVGISTGIINTMAGSGSLVTLPIFIFICGLPPSVANASNRIGIFMQSLVATIKYGQIEPGIFKNTKWIIIPSIAGALIGSKIAVDIDEKTMNYTIGILMVLMLVLLLFKPEKWLIEKQEKTDTTKTWLSVITYFIIGLYGGFLQAGVGLFLLAGLVLVSKLSLKKSNGIKVMLVLAYTAPALLLFMYYGKVHYGYGILMGIFQSIGAWLAVRFIAKLPNANLWIYRLLIVDLALSSLKFFI